MHSQIVLSNIIFQQIDSSGLISPLFYFPCISNMFVDWPADAGGSETLMKVVDKLDAECAHRCDCWELEDCVRFALIWVRYSFR